MNSGEPFAKVNPKNFGFFSLAKVSPRKVTKILEKCFQNMYCFSWIKLISVLIHLEY